MSHLVVREHCPRCGGSGCAADYPWCPRCDGDGLVTREPTADDFVAHLAAQPDGGDALLRELLRADPDRAVRVMDVAQSALRTAGDRLREYRAERCLSLGDAARRLGVRVSTLSDAERGRNADAPTLLAALAGTT